MAKYIIKRLVAGVLSLFILITITFFLMHVIPGGPFSPSEQRNVPEKILEQISENMVSMTRFRPSMSDISAISFMGIWGLPLKTGYHGQ